MASRPHPPAQPHGEIRELLPNVFFVTGTMSMSGGPMPIRFSRNMTIVREGDRLVIINSVRLDEAGLKQLDKLGKVTDVVRLAAMHGMDDPFYQHHYGARTWTVKGSSYVAGFDSNAAPYHTSDEEMHDGTKLPIAGAKLYSLASTPPEGLLLLERDGGILISGDCLQNWHKPDAYFSLFARPMMRFMGFIKAHNVGPAWFKRTKPPVNQLLGLLDLEFDHVVPAHGTPVLGGAKASYRPRIEALRSQS